MLEHIQRIANLPDVLPWVARGFDYVDLSAYFDRPGNLAFGEQGGAILFAPMGSGRYEMHWLLGPTMRGRRGLALTRAAFDWLFTQHHATAIEGAVSRDNRRARAMCRALGCYPVGETHDRTGQPCIQYEMGGSVWAILSAASLAAQGRSSEAAKPTQVRSKARSKP